MKIMQQIIIKNYPSSLHRQDSNSRPLKFESPHTAARPRLFLNDNSLASFPCSYIANKWSAMRQKTDTDESQTEVLGSANRA